MPASQREQVLPTICGLLPHQLRHAGLLEGGKAGAGAGQPQHPANGGHLCVKGLAAAEVVYSPQRLKKPLKRVGSGFLEVSWDEALDLMANRLLEIKARHGARALVQCGGAPVTEENRDAFAQLMAAYGSPNRTSPGHLCSYPRRIALHLVYGGRSDCDYAQARLVLAWGANPADSMRPGEAAVYGRFDRVLPEARKRGARVIVIDPRCTPTAATADEWVPIQPGTDAALGLAMLNVIIGEGLYDQGFVEQWTVGFPQLREHVRPFTPEWAEPQTGIPAAKTQELARTYATTRPALIREGNGLDMHPNVVQTVRLIGMLQAVTGNVDIPGGNVFFPSPPLSPYPTARLEDKPLGSERYPLYPDAVFPAVVDALLTGEPYQPKAMIVHHANPVLVNANAGRVREALGKLEFLVVCDLFLTATASIAHLVLPETSDLERYGYRGYSSAQGGLVALRQPVVEPVGQGRPVFEVEYELAQRMSLSDSYPWRTTQEWIDYRLRPSEVTVEQLKSEPILYTTPAMEYRKYLRAGFATPSGKIELYSERLRSLGYQPLPTYVEPAGSHAIRLELAGDFPLVGTTRKPPMYVHTRFRNIPRLHKLQPEPLARIHPLDAAARGIGEGQWVTVASPQGRIELRATLSQETPPGQVVVDFGWGNPWDGGPNVHALIGDEARDPISATTSNRRFLCQVSRADPLSVDGEGARG